MPSLFKRSNGIYYIAYNDGGRVRWKSTGQRLKPLAITVLLDFKNLLGRPRGRVSFSQFEQDFLCYAASSYSVGTLDIYRRTLAQLRALIGDVWLSTITPKHIDLYKTERLKSIAPVTLNIELRTLRAAFSTALRWKYLETNPSKGVKLVQVPEQTPTFFTREDFDKLVSLIKEHWLREIVFFAVLTGLRRGEIVNLKWSDVDLDRRLIHIQSSLKFRTKLGKRRTVPLNDVAAQLLQSKYGKSTSEYVFTLNDRKISENWISHKFKYYIYEAKLNNYALHFHSLRHTFATWLVQEGVSIYEVQKLLGHSSISVTQIYSHLAASELHSAVNKISVSLN